MGKLGIRQVRQREIERIRNAMHSHPSGPDRSANEVALEHTTRSEHLADQITAVVGSWRFIITQSLLLVTWLMVNGIGLVLRWDPYPFILLNLVLSFQAAFTAPVIMMSQNRQSARDRIVAELDFAVNQVAAKEIDILQEKLDVLTSRQWDSLLEMLAEHQESLIVLNERTIAIESAIHSLRDSGKAV